MSYDWDNHYKSGGQSGDPEDYKKVRGWKLGLVEKYANLETDRILDVGCGDLQFWNGRLPPHYRGVDISYSIICQNRKSFPGNPFLCADASNPLPFTADVILCFDMLWHIIDDEDYVAILRNIKKNAVRNILIFTWSSDPTKADLWAFVSSRLCDIKRGGYQKYRDFQKIALPIFEPEFKLVEVAECPSMRFGSMYVFRRVE